MIRKSPIFEQLKSQEDVKNFFQKMVDDKKAWMDCVCKGRPLSELEKRGMKVAKLNEIFD